MEGRKMTNKYRALHNEEGRFTPEAAKIIRRYLMGSPFTTTFVLSNRDTVPFKVTASYRDKSLEIGGRRYDYNLICYEGKEYDIVDLESEFLMDDILEEIRIGADNPPSLPCFARNRYTGVLYYFYEPFGCIHATLGWPGIDLPSIYDEQWEVIPFDKVPGAIERENGLVIAGRNRGNSE